MAHEPNKDPQDTRRKPPIFLRMADEGNVPGLPSATPLVFIVAIAVLGLAAIYFVMH